MALSATVKVSINAVRTKTADFESASSAINQALSVALTDGTGANQADLIFKDTVTLAASGTADLDLAGALTDIYGAAQVFARLKAIVVTADSGNTNNVNVTRPASNGVPLFLAASDGIAVRPGGAFVWVAPDATGVAVTASTGDLLTFTNSAGTTGVTYSVTLIGASA
jgi:hypothetical protein